MLEIHSTHAASGHSRSGFLLGELGHHGLGGDQEARNRSRILQRGANDLRRVDNARLNQVLVFFGLRVKAETVFASDAAGLLALAGVAIIGSLIIFTLSVNRSVSQAGAAHH